MRAVIPGLELRASAQRIEAVLQTPSPSGARLLFLMGREVVCVCLYCVIHAMLIHVSFIVVAHLVLFDSSPWSYSQAASRRSLSS
ncbi:hypothetical protein M430DRAFT_149693 [Amorphotheca resinae ATCC 22711]|jgi:hypothetical protein|uniref:Uncharacterized protein n=1 Tax=Amorphotheca resinae ATCC 22711 TaxID=857342 RepID=A0A2T3BCH4_AMORE|nr:hypothetical protein M430DRAFT_149693 [Amorphotheca resinae ATCC 22711]PSS27095.1 hypothetical protein M430DRAFT_149693 [Amorphotheca resinae ATCC 22711]